MVRQFALLTLSALLLSACASEKEKQARRDNAFDLQGEYNARKAKSSEIDLDITITNQSGRDNIRAEVKRTTAQEPQEQDFLKKHNLNPEQVAAHFGTKIIVGESSERPLTGGENISDDFGESSKFAICSDIYQYDAAHEVSYCLSGLISRADYVLRGSWTLNLRTKTKTKDEKGREVTESRYERLELKYSAAPPNGYFEQAFGVWSGQISRAWGVTTDLKGADMLTITKLSKEEFSVVPAQTQITYKGQVYEYVAQRFAISSVGEMDVPMFEVLYRLKGSAEPLADRVLLFGQVYSLGKLVGTAVHIKGQSEEQIASFSLVRK